MDSRAALFNPKTEKWEQIDEGELKPAPRKAAQLAYKNGTVYLYAGYRPGTETDAAGAPYGSYEGFFRELWKMSLSDRVWEVVEVPASADLQGARAAFLGNELHFLGYRCGGGDLYDVKTGAWTRSASKNAPETPGHSHMRGNTMAVDAVPNPDDFPYYLSIVWIFEK